MPDPAERFIAAAVRPLGDNAELRMMAEQELRAAISTGPGKSGCDSLEEAAANLERGWPGSRWKSVLYVVTALAAILAAVPVARDYMRYRLATYALFAMGDPGSIGLPGLPFSTHSQSKVPEIIGDFTSSERLLLFGDLSKSDNSARFKALWESDPTSPVLFAEYGRAGITGPLPADFLKTADRLDPGNAWFRYFAAAVAAWNAVGETPAHIRKRGGLHSKKYTIKDPASFAEAIKLLEEAARLPRVESYHKDLLLRRLEILPVGEDVLGRKLTEGYLQMVPPDPVWMYGQIAMAVAARSRELALSGDTRGFLDLVKSWEAYLRRSIEAANSTRQATWPMSKFKEAAMDVAMDARVLGLEQVETRFTRMKSALDTRRSSTQVRWDERRKLREKGEPASHNLLYWSAQVENPPPLVEADLKPGRLAFLAMQDRIAAAVMGAVMLAAAVLTASLRFMRGLQARSLSGSLLQVLRPADQAWILLGGVLVPVIIHLLLEEFPPFGVVEVAHWGIGFSFGLRPSVLAGLILILPYLIASRRIGRRLECLGWGKRTAPVTLVLGMGMAILLASRLSGVANSEVGFVVAILIAGIPLIVSFFAIPMGAFASPRNETLPLLTCCRAVVPAYVFGVLLMSLLIPVHHAREKHWTRLNVLTRIEPGVPAMNRYEYEVAKRVRAELLEILETK